MSRSRAWQVVVVSAVLVFLADPIRGEDNPGGILSGLAALADTVRGGEDPDRTLSPYFFVEGPDASVEAFPLESTEVVAAVGGVIADVRVTQTYRNEGTRPINARYVFPGSTRAAIHGMKIRIGDEVVVAKIKERERARREFEEARARGRSASLLEQQRPNVFTMSVANILPGDRVEVELHYTELLVTTEGTYEFVFPAVVGPRYSGQPGSAAGALDLFPAVVGLGHSNPLESAEEERDTWVRSPYLHEAEEAPSSLDVRVILSTGIPLQDVGSPSHQVDVSWESESVATVTLAEPPDSCANRDFVLSYRLAGEEIQSGLLLHEGEKENFFLLMVQPPERVEADEIPPREYVFVLDVSGSMDGFPLDTAKSVIRSLVGGLRSTDRFNVVLFAGGSRVMAPSSVPASVENVRRAIDVIDGVWGGGGTELAAALGRAMGLPRDEAVSRTVVVITDGLIAAEREVFEIIQANLSRTNVFCFGIGSSVNRYLVEGIARAGVGEPFVVTDPSGAADAARRFRAYIESPVLTDLRVAYDGFEAYDVEPPALPDLFAERPIVLFGKWRGKPAGEIEVSGRGGSRPYVGSFQVSESKPLAENSALAHLWARARVARLSDFNVGGEDAAIGAEVTSLGLEYSLLTKYTSFIAVIEKVRNPEADALDADQPSPLPRGVSNRAVGIELFSGPEPELWILVTGVVSLLALTALARRRRAVR